MKQQKNTRYGFQIDEPKETDYIFGSFSPLPYDILQLDGDWRDYLPVKEFQNLNNVEPSMCVTMTVLNCIETLIKRKYGEDKNYSDRFLAAISGTAARGGNTPRNVCDCLRKIGVVPQEIWPFGSEVDTFDKFYKEIPQDIQDMGKEFLNEWDFKYEMVPSSEEDITAALKTSPLLISVAGWHEDNGIFYRPPGITDNHATTMVYERPGEYRQVFDSYDSPHIKDVDWNAIPMQVVRFHIERKIKVVQNKKKYWFVEFAQELFFFTRDMVVACFNSIKEIFYA